MPAAPRGLSTGLNARLCIREPPSSLRGDAAPVDSCPSLSPCFIPTNTTTTYSSLIFVSYSFLFFHSVCSSFFFFFWYTFAICFSVFIPCLFSISIYYFLSISLFFLLHKGALYRFKKEGRRKRSRRRKKKKKRRKRKSRISDNILLALETTKQ